MNGRLTLWSPGFSVLIMALLANQSSSGQENQTSHDQAVSTPAERAELLDQAKATWRSFEQMIGPSGLVADRLQPDAEGNWKRSELTSPTDIASYLWSALAARILGLISDAEADRQIGKTLTTLGRIDRDHGFYFNLYNIQTGLTLGVGGDESHPARPFLSSVDNAWLAAALTMIRNDRPTLRAQADALLEPMDFGFFYGPFDPADPIKHPGHFHGGYYPDDRTFTTFYGMLNTEPRLISYLAIARHQVPADHYYRMYRTYPADRGHQSQRPIGVTRSYLDVPVFEGHYQYDEMDFVPSWGGSMFEALMVPLFVPEEKWAPKSWGINHPIYVQAQIHQGLEVRRYGYWGFSPSWTPEAGYQTYGVSQLATEVDGYRTYEIPTEKKAKRGQEIGKCYEGIVTVHASFLALRYAPREALNNIRALIKAFPIFTPTEGFHDSVNVTTGAVSRCVLALDQGMILAAIANALANDALRHAFCDGPIEATIRPLISPEEFTAGKPRQP